MTKNTWKKRIEQACRDAGTYKPFYDDTIDTLAGILENRDKAQKQFKAMDSNPVVMHTNKGGNTNIVKNPALVIINEMNMQALQYWRELGLTAKSFQQLEKAGAITKSEKTLDDLLGKIGV